MMKDNEKFKYLCKWCANCGESRMGMLCRHLLFKDENFPWDGTIEEIFKYLDKLSYVYGEGYLMGKKMKDIFEELKYNYTCYIPFITEDSLLLYSKYIPVDEEPLEFIFFDNREALETYKMRKKQYDLRYL